MKPSDLKRLKRKPFRTAAVLGAGVMGSQIAAHLANAGLSVYLLDIPAKEGSKNAIVDGAFKKMLKMKPSPVVDSSIQHRIKTGNFDDHLDVVAKADWVIEVIIEQLQAKKDLMEKLVPLVAEHAVISSNTSGLPISKITEGLPEDFRKRFLGTHFFNPPRYLKLLEVIPTPQTDASIVDRIKWFGRMHLGKGMVIAKDTPNFIANRVGTYSMMLSIKALDDGFTIEEIDALTGTLTGRPRSATFRTADVVGLDTLTYVSKNLYAAIPNDESRDAFKIPAVLQKLVDDKRLGSKSGKGFYFKDGKEIKSLNPETMEYDSRKPLNLGDIESLKKVKSLSERWKKLFEAESRAGNFIREHTTKLITYALNRVPEISDYPADVDNAVAWGFGWEMGPFKIHDWIGHKPFIKSAEKMKLELPEWYHKMVKQGHTSFYKGGDDSAETCFMPGTGYKETEVFADELTVTSLKTKDGRNEIWNNEESGLLDSGDGVLIFEFRSKANTLGTKVLAGLRKSLEIVEDGNYKGIVVANDGANFSVGANLGELAYAAQNGDFKTIEKAVENFQKTVQLVRYSSKPVVMAIRGKVLGGGCEFIMGAANVVASTETYMGLVELGVGLIPAGTGAMSMIARAGERAPDQHPSRIQPFMQKAFETIAMAKVSKSAHEAIELGYMDPDMRISMHDGRRIHIAREEVIRLYNQGYAPPAVREHIFVPGKPGLAPLETAAWMMQKSGWITEYDAFLAKKLAYVMCGGSLNGPDYVHEDYLIELEREVFLSLLGEEKTQARIHSILTTNKPLRN